MAKFKKLELAGADPTINVEAVESVRPGADAGESVVRMVSGLEYAVDDPVSEVVAFLKAP